MKRNAITFVTTLLLTFLLAACGGFGVESEKVEREPLDVSQWPTPPAPQVAASPTPFPKSSAPPAAVATVAPVDEAGTNSGAAGSGPKLSAENLAQLAQLAQSNGIDLSKLDLGSLDLSNLNLDNLDLSKLDLSGIDLSSIDLSNLDASQLAALAAAAGSGDASGITEILGGTTTDLLNQASILSNLSPVATLTTSAPTTVIRQGPGGGYGAIESVEQGELGAVLGQNPGGDWLYIITINNVTGWIPAADARIVGTLDEAPVLPADPVAAFARQLVSSGSDSGKNNNATAATGSGNPAAGAIDLDALEPATTARVSSELLNLRQRPGGSYKLLGTLPADTELAVLGLNRDGQWALISTAEDQAGWVSIDGLSVTGSLDGAPRFRTLEATGNDGPAPVIDAAGAPPVSQSTVAASSAATDSTGNTLTPSATANVNVKVDMRPQPAEDFAPLSTATVDETVTVIAKNSGGDWLLIRRPNGKMGWVPAASLTITNGFVENAQPVMTALVSSNNLPLLGGPGIFFDPVGQVNLNDFVSLLGINPGRNWVLVETASGARGWIQLRLINNISGALDDLPEISVDPLTQTGPAGPQPPAPAGPPAGTLVLQTSSGGDIMTINADGTGLRKISHGIDPVLSPDGRQVAFTRWQGDSGSLWVANTDGSGERFVLGEMRKAKGPDWSPDGRQVVLNYQHGGRTESKSDCVSLGSRPPINASDFYIKTDENGKPIALCFTIPPDPHWGLRVIDVSSGNYTDEYGGQYAFRPAWDPQQEWRVVSAAGNGLLGIDVNNEDFRQQLTNILGDGSPVFSPDGRFIAVTTRGQDGANIFRMNADGSGRVQLTQTPLWEGIRPDQSTQPWNNVAPAWSPDGARIAFLTDRNGRWEIWVMNADGSDQRPLFSDDINDQLAVEYNFVDERALSWR